MADLIAIRLYYSGAGVWVDLSTGGGRWGDAEGDKFARIENVEGSRFYDVLIGDRGDNVLSGYSRLLGGALAGDELRGNEATTACSAAGTTTRSGAVSARTTSTAAAATTVSSMPACPTARLPPSERRRRMTRSTGQVSMVRSICRASTPTRRLRPREDDRFSFSPFSDVFTGAGQLRIERHDDRSNVLGETTGDGVADLMIRVSGSVYLEASDIHILG